MKLIFVQFHCLSSSRKDVVSKRLVSKRLCIEMTGFVFMNSDTYDMGNRKNKDPNKRAKRRATGTTKIKFKE